MQISDYNYELPTERIAQRPVSRRGQSRLLVLDRTSGNLADKRYGDLVNYLSAGDVLVLNDTKVFPARLIATDSSGRQRELIILESHGDSPGAHSREALCRGRLRPGDELRLGQAVLRVERASHGIATLTTESNFDELIARYGQVPLPPYMKRAATADDSRRYQTVFAKAVGSVAAPTASLNMTDGLLERLRDKGVEVCYLTLHVGLGTFLPIRTDKVEEHKMHSEYFVVPTATRQSILRARADGHRVIAVGTTVARTLEYAHDTILEEDESPISGEADIFIYPGYKFQLVDGLVTNFHAPRSTVLMLVAAFAGWQKLHFAYQHALKSKYDFLSYGDSMLII